MLVQIFDKTFVPGLGRGPFIKPINISESLFRNLRILNFQVETYNETKVTEDVVEEVTEDVVEDLKLKTNKELKSILTQMNVKFNSTDNKATLISLIKNN